MDDSLNWNVKLFESHLQKFQYMKEMGYKLFVILIAYGFEEYDRYFEMRSEDDKSQYGDLLVFELPLNAIPLDMLPTETIRLRAEHPQCSIMVGIGTHQGFSDYLIH
jgi:hypothetical protein